MNNHHLTLSGNLAHLKIRNLNQKQITGHHLTVKEEFSAPEDVESESETDEQSPSDTEWESGEEPESETDDRSPSDSEEELSAPEDVEPKSETDEQSPSDTEWDSGAPEDEEPESETDDRSPSDSEEEVSAPEDVESESETDNRSPSDSEEEFSAPEDEESESETDDRSPSDSEEEFSAPEDVESESETDDQSPSDSEKEFSAPEDVESESETDDQSPSDSEKELSAPEDVEPESETDDRSPSDSEQEFSAPEDEEPESETDEQSPSDNEQSPSDSKWDFSAPEDEEPESETDELSPSDTEWESGEEPESETDDRSPSDSEEEFSAPEDVESESETNERSPSDSEQEFSAPEDEESESETDERSPSDSEQEFSAPEDVESESEKDDRSPSDSEQEVSAPEDVESESETDEQSPFERMESDLQQNVVSPTNDEWDTGTAPAGPDSETLRSRRSQRTAQGTPESVSSAYDTKVPEPLNIESKKGTLSLNVPDKRDTGKESGFRQKISEKKDKMPLSTASGLAGLSIAHGTNRDLNLNIHLDPNMLNKPGGNTKAEKKKKSEKKSSGAVVTALTTMFVLGALLLVLLMTAFFAFAWPIRKYFEKLSKRMDNVDVESGRRDDYELTSIRVDKNYPPASQPTPSYPHRQQETTAAYYQGPVVARRAVAGSGRNVVVANRQPCPSEVPRQTEQNEATSDKKEVKTKEDVINDDKKRDSRNAERRKIIKQQTSQRRGSLADSINVAKSVIDGHAKNKQFEKKASERRRVIKQCTSAAGSATGENKRCMSFAEELQTSRSVITPDKDHTKSVERSKERCRKIKDQCTGKRRQSLAEEIGVAKEVIVGSEKKCEIPPAVVEEVTVEQVPGNCKSYSDSDISELKYRCNQAANTTSYQDVNELDELRRWGFTRRFIFDSDEEANWNLI
ncbi:hypothetical protein ACROYT_G033479 [Oculina patagonica]